MARADRSMVASHIPPDLKDKLEAKARERKMSVSAVLHELIEQYVAK